MSMNRMILATAALAILTSQASADQWWILHKQVGASAYDTNAFNRCAISEYSPAEYFQDAKDEGRDPRIEEGKSTVSVILKDVNEVTGLPSGKFITVQLFRTKEACEEVSKSRKEAKETEQKELDRFR
jgi:hypothetical protein